MYCKGRCSRPAPWSTTTTTTTKSVVGFFGDGGPARRVPRGSLVVQIIEVRSASPSSRLTGHCPFLELRSAQLGHLRSVASARRVPRGSLVDQIIEVRSASPSSRLTGLLELRSGQPGHLRSAVASASGVPLGGQLAFQTLRSGQPRSSSA